MNMVLDACAIIAYLHDEDGAEVVDSILKDNNYQCFAHALNICEVYYGFMRAKDELAAKAAIAEIEAAEVVIIDTIDRELWQLAGQLKARNRLSLADSIALALAMRMQAELVTSDHHELDRIAAQGICPIHFIR